MQMSDTQLALTTSDRRSKFKGIATWTRSMRVRILTSFIAIGLVAGALGGLAGIATYRAGHVVSRSVEASLRSVGEAEAASQAFSTLRGSALRRSAPFDMRAFKRDADALHNDISARLSRAGQASSGPHVEATLADTRSALEAWVQSLHALRDDEAPDGAHWSALEESGAAVESRLTRLVQDIRAATALDEARAIAANDFELIVILGGTVFAVLVPGLIGWFLAYRSVRPIVAASAVAAEIADGRFDDELPDVGDDELGAMLAAMAKMRTSIRAAMEREVALRRSAQTRLADALESSQDGIIVVDADLRIALANGQAADFLGVKPAMLAAGEPITQLTGASRSSRKFLLELMGLQGRAEESLLADGRWLRVSRSWTRDGGFIALCSDISVQKEQEAALKATNLRLDAALENMSQGLCLFGADQTVKVVNRRFSEIFGLRPDAVRAGMALREVIRQLSDAHHFPNRTVEDVFLEERRVLQSRTRNMRFLEVAGGRIIGIATEALADGGWLATYEDVTERRKAEERIAYMARHDGLTELPNRVLFVERIQDAINLARRGAGSAVFCLDLDHFKNVNDTLGHPIGDELLRIVAKRLKGCVRDIDTVARLGGDEFAIVQTGIESPQEAVGLANRVIERLALPFQIDGHSMSVGVSIGIALAPEDGKDHDKLLKSADVALYRAKEDGRGTWRFFEAEMDSRLQARREMEIDLRRAVDEQQFEVYFQPQFDLRLDRISGFEALIRWHHPVRGIVPPLDFIGLAEEIGLIKEIGTWVLRTACIEASRWAAPLRIAVNVSPVQLRHTEFCDVVSEALAMSGLQPNRLELEITESVMLSSNSSALELLHQIHGLGVQLSMDDFGTGYSSLTSLRSFPFDKIKIDRSFVNDLCEGSAGEPFVRAVISLGHGLGIRITAEGVETAEQLARLRIEGCTEVQGYLISPPTPASNIPQMLDRWNAGSRRGLVAAVA